MGTKWLQMNPEQRAHRQMQRQRWRAANVERVRETARRYRATHVEQQAAHARKYDETHRQERREKAAKYRLDNPRKAAEIRRRHYLKCRTQILARKAERRAAIRRERNAAAESATAGRLAKLAAEPLSVLEQTALYARIQAMLPKSFTSEVRAEVATIAYIAVYDGRLSVDCGIDEMRAIIRQQRREAFGDWTVSLDATNKHGRTFGQRLGIY